MDPAFDHGPDKEFMAALERGDHLELDTELGRRANAISDSIPFNWDREALSPSGKLMLRLHEITGNYELAKKASEAYERAEAANNQHQNVPKDFVMDLDAQAWEMIKRAAAE